MNPYPVVERGKVFQCPAQCFRRIGSDLFEHSLQSSKHPFDTPVLPRAGNLGFAVFDAQRFQYLVP